MVENIPDKREQIETQIPGFPDPEITHPNIRFQQTKSMPREMKRTDSMPVKYRRDNATGHYKPAVDQKAGKSRHWNIARLSSRENPLVLFTLSAQAAIGLFAILFLGNLLGVKAIVEFVATPYYPLAVICSISLVAFGLFMSTVHLGKPLRFYRGFNNLRHSPVAREGAGVASFMAFAGLHMLAVLASQAWLAERLPVLNSVAPHMAIVAKCLGSLALIAAAIGLYYMYRCYRIKARPFWDHRHTGFAFFGCSLYLGALSLAVIGVPLLWFAGSGFAALLAVSCTLMAAGLLLEGLGLTMHASDMMQAESEGAVSHYVQRTTFGKTWIARNTLLVVTVLGLCAASLLQGGALGLVLWAILAIATLVVAIVGRALFYVLVVPTTMPGAFFWKNKGFEEHARDIGLADMPQVGVAPLRH